MCPAHGTSDIVHGVAISHGDRVVYPEAKLTKTELARYFEAVAPLMLPHIRMRPLSIVRCPEGVKGECFFQKHWPAQRSQGIRTIMVEETEGVTEPYAVATSPEELVALVQNGKMEVHVWGSRGDDVERPDRMVIDLDPGPGVGWSTVRESARAVRALLSEMGLESWVKVTGGKGVHVAVPIERRIDWDTMSGFAKAVATHMARELPDTFVAKASKAVRNNRIFVDWLRNTRGATWVAPWSTRAKAEASVSMPLTWEALDDVKGADTFTIPAVLDIVGRRYRDPWRDMLTVRQRYTADMLHALGEG